MLMLRCEIQANALKKIIDRESHQQLDGATVQPAKHKDLNATVWLTYIDLKKTRFYSHSTERTH